MIQAAGLWKLGRFLAELVFVIFTDHPSPLLLTVVIGHRVPSRPLPLLIATFQLSFAGPRLVVYTTGSGSPSIAGTTDQMVRHLGISLQSTDGSSTMERNDASLQV